MARESLFAVDDEKVALFVVVKVAAIDPDVELILSAPVVNVNPFDAVKVEALVIVPELVVDILPVVEIVMLLAKSPPAIVPSKISVDETPPVLMETAPDEVEK